MRKEKNVNDILDDLSNHLNEICNLCFDYKWSTKESLDSWITGKYSVEKYGNAKDLNEFLDDINNALINLNNYRTDEKE